MRVQTDSFVCLFSIAKIGKNSKKIILKPFEHIMFHLTTSHKQHNLLFFYHLKNVLRKIDFIAKKLLQKKEGFTQISNQQGINL